MPTVPQFNKEESLNGAALPYQDVHLNEYMTGEAQAKALGKAAEGLGKLGEIAANIQNTIDETKTVQFNNAVEQWKQDNLLDEQNGYFNKQGADASGQTANVMKNYDDFVSDWKKNNKVSRKGALQIDHITQMKRTSIYDGVLGHDQKQTAVWAKSEGDLAIQNAVTDAISNRDNPDKIALNVANAISTAQWQANIQHLDKATTNALIADYKSKIYQGVLDTKIQEGDLSAKNFFDEHKEEIDQKLHSHYIGAIKNEEDKYTARTMANDIIAKSKTEQDAINAAEKIKDVNMSDKVLSRVKQHYSEEEHFKNLAQKEALNKFYTKAVEVAQNGGVLSYDDIPDNLDPQDKLSLMNYINKNGEQETDNQIWEMLYDKQINDAQGFVKEDLNKYRGFLSDSEYKSFLKKQEDIRAGKFYSNIKDDNAMIKEALKTMGLDKGNNPLLFDGGNKKETAFNEIRSMVREYEARKGRKVTDDELQNFTNSLGYKGQDGVMLYKQLERGMNERVGFVKDVMNDFVYYEKTHNGQIPSNEEKMKIINNRLNSKAQEKTTSARSLVNNYSYNAGTIKNIAATKARPNEQKVLTYFADNQIPTIGKQLGLNLNVTSRYRNQTGSHHAEGRAADVSMSEHKSANRIRIYEQLLKLSTVQKIGTSDPIILTKFAGNPKIVDERKYDKQHGTNHVNHAHVTLINYNPSNTKVAAKNGVYKY